MLLRTTVSHVATVYKITIWLTISAVGTTEQSWSKVMKRTLLRAFWTFSALSHSRAAAAIAQRSRVFIVASVAVFSFTSGAILANVMVRSSQECSHLSTSIRYALVSSPLASHCDRWLMSPLPATLPRQGWSSASLLLDVLRGVNMR